MTIPPYIKTVVAGAFFASMTFSTQAITVPGTSDPWLANASIDNIGTPEPPDIAPFESPVLFGAVTAGTVISWSATGTVGHPGDVAGPDGAAGVIVNHMVGANNGISDITVPIDSLIGVWAFPGGGTTFLMGSSGSAVVPAGATQLFLGTMDAFGWANNVGAFEVEVSVTPDAGSSFALLSLAVGGLGLVRRKLRA